MVQTFGSKLLKIIESTINLVSGTNLPKHLDYKSIEDYIGKFCRMSEDLPNMRQIYPNMVLIYFLISKLGDEHHSWANFFVIFYKKS